MQQYYNIPSFQTHVTNYPPTFSSLFPASSFPHMSSQNQLPYQVQFPPYISSSSPQQAQFKMRVSCESSLNGDTEQASKYQLSQKKRKVEHVEEIVDEIPDENEARTPTPAKPQNETGPNNPEAKAEDVKAAQEEFLGAKKMLRIVIGAIILILLVGGITILFLNRSKFTVEVVLIPEPVKLAGNDASVQTEKMNVKDPETFNTDANIPVTANKITSNQGLVSNGRLLQEKQQEYATYTVLDPQTATTITVSSQTLQIKASFVLTNMLEYALRAQPPPPLPEGVDEQAPRNLQDGAPKEPIEKTILVQELIFYSVADRVAQTLKQSLPASDQNTQVTQETCFDLQYNKNINAFEFVESIPNTGALKAAVLHDPATVPIIKDHNNQTEVGLVIGKIALKMIQKAREFFKKRLPALQSAANVELPPLEPTNGASSIYVDQPEDIGKLCVIIDGIYRCNQRMVPSNLINIAAPASSANILPVPTIVVRTTATE